MRNVPNAGLRLGGSLKQNTWSATNSDLLRRGNIVVYRHANRAERCLAVGWIAEAEHVVQDEQ
jgi:hypothetical protein